MNRKKCNFVTISLAHLNILNSDKYLLADKINFTSNSVVIGFTISILISK